MPLAVPKSESENMEELNRELLTYIKTLELAVVSKDKTIGEQQRDIAKYQKKLDSAIELAEGMSSKSEVANTIFDDNLERMNELIIEKSNLQGQMLLMQSSRDLLTDKVDSLEKDISDLRAEKKELIASIEDLNHSLKDTASVTEMERQQEVVERMKAELLSYRDMEDTMVDMRTKVEIMEVDNQQLRDSLSRLKDLGEDSQQEIFNANDAIADLKDQLGSKTSQISILQSQIDGMEKTLGSLKTKADKASAQCDKLKKKCESLVEENGNFRSEISNLKAEVEKVDIDEKNGRLEREVKSLKNDIVAYKGWEGDKKFEVESLRAKIAEQERHSESARGAWEVERATLLDEKNAVSTALSTLKAEHEASTGTYSQVLSEAQMQLHDLMKDTTESKRVNRALSAGLMKLKSKITRQCEFSMDADDSLKKELLKVFTALGDKVDKGFDRPRSDIDSDDAEAYVAELVELRNAKESLEGQVASSAAELRKEKARYDQSLAESNFSIIDLKREKKELMDLLDNREEQLHFHVGQIEEGRTTIRQLEEDMEEAREAYKDLSRSTADIIARAQQDSPVLDARDSSLMQELEATVREQDDKLKAYQATIEALQQAQQKQRRAPPTPAVEMKAIAEKLSQSQQQVHDLQRQKAELLEQMIEMASMQQQQQQVRSDQRMSPTDLQVSSDDNDENEDEYEEDNHDEEDDDDNGGEEEEDLTGDRLVG